MPQLAIYLDKETARRLNDEAAREGKSRSALARELLQKALPKTFPDSFWAALGSWEDSREPDEILRDIRANSEQPPRPELT